MEALDGFKKGTVTLLRVVSVAQWRLSLVTVECEQAVTKETERGDSECRQSLYLPVKHEKQGAKAGLGVA